MKKRSVIFKQVIIYEYQISEILKVVQPSEEYNISFHPFQND